MSQKNWDIERLFKALDLEGIGTEGNLQKDGGLLGGRR